MHASTLNTRIPLEKHSSTVLLREDDTIVLLTVVGGNVATAVLPGCRFFPLSKVGFP